MNQKAHDQNCLKMIKEKLQGPTPGYLQVSEIINMLLQTIPSVHLAYP